MALLSGYTVRFSLVQLKHTIDTCRSRALCSVLSPLRCQAGAHSTTQCSLVSSKNHRVTIRNSSKQSTTPSVLTTNDGRFLHGQKNGLGTSTSVRSPDAGEHTASVPGLKQQFKERRLLGWSRKQMYDLVADIDNYKDFLPWCTESVVLSRDGTGCRAEIEVGFPPVRERYTSLVTFNKPSMIMATAEDSELFKELVNKWHFVPGPSKHGGDSTYVDVYVSYEFRNPLHALLAKAAFDKVAKQMIQAFEHRAAVVYGPSIVDHKG
eukprot:m.149530 g.149530  ORF g.149530 m.149530 type:complete len:265 (-) comp17819_c0_seq1:233-1027(-)